MITQGRIRELLDYNPLSGDLIWKVARGGTAKAGDVAGCLYTDRGGKKYTNIGIDSKSYRAHRIIWMHVHGVFPDQIDHINGDGLDNRLVNLRSVDGEVNQKNKKISTRNTSGHQGVYWDKRDSKWRVRASKDKKQICLGSYSCKEEAISVRKQAEIDLNYHKNHGRLA